MSTPEGYVRKQDYYDLDSPRYQGLAGAKGYDQSNPNCRLNKLRYSHEAMIDVIVAEPGIKQNELASRFGVTVPWISRIIGSDAFQGALAKRREELTDPFLIATIEERLKGVAMQSLDVIAEKLALPSVTMDGAMKALDITAKAMGFGARISGQTNVQNNFVVALPAKAVSSESWAESHGGGQGAVIEHKSFNSTTDRDPLIQPKAITPVEDE
jgi:hypothetical protein